MSVVTPGLTLRGRIEGQEHQMAEETGQDGTEQEPVEVDPQVRAETAERQLAFVRAGIDFEKGTGKLVYDTYKGDPDPDSVKAYVEEIGVDLTPPTPAPQEPDGPEFTDDEREASARRRGVSTGSSSDDGTEDPRRTAVKAIEQSIVDKPRQDALVDGIRVLATAAKNGDKRVLVSGREPR
jgi:hypothetical protein